MGIKVVTPPAVEPVTLAEARLHLRIDADQTDEDDLIQAFISAAREEAEHLTGRAIPEQTIELALDAFPEGAIELPRGAIVSVESVTYVDEAGATQTVDSADYALDDSQLVAWLLPAYNFDWPATREQANAVRVRYVAGYASCPALIKSWILLRVGTLYAHREADAERPPAPSDFAVRLLDRFAIPSL
jgi:uncharacterized phiE125 gp8 family phage protein